MGKLRFLVLALFSILPAIGQSVSSPPSLTELEQQAAKQPAVKGAHHDLGVAYYRAGKLADAERAFEIAMTEDPSDLESVQMRGLALYRLGRPGDAIPYLERVRQWMPHADADANHVLGLAYLNARRYNDSRAAFAAQFGLAANSASAWLINAQMLMAGNLPEFAAKDAQKAVELSPNLPLAHFLIGQVALFNADLTGAQKEFEKERAINPAYSAVYDRLGDVYTRSGQYQLAQEALTRAISLDQSFTGPFIQMGKIFLRTGDPQSAATYLEHAEKMDPTNFMTHTLLGQAYRAQGKEQDARREMETAGKIHSANELKLEPVK